MSTNNFGYKSILMSSLLCVTVCSTANALFCDVELSQILIFMFRLAFLYFR